MVTISRAWYDGSYTMAAKPIKMQELHYTMIYFLISTFTAVVVGIQSKMVSQSQISLFTNFILFI